MKIRYQAWLKTRSGCGEETIALPEGVTTVGLLLDWLVARGEREGKAFDFIATVMVSVNHRSANKSQPVTDSDEISLMPPIAGG
jgi:molybdopterin converting factor subunit 1